DAADKSGLAIHHDNLAMQTAEHIGSHPEGTRTGIEDAQRNAGIHHRDQKRRAQVEGAVAVHHDLNTRSVFGGGDQGLLQLLPDFIVRDDEGFEQYFFPRVADAVKDTRIKTLAVDQQLNTVAVAPGVILLHRNLSTSLIMLQRLSTAACKASPASLRTTMTPGTSFSTVLFRARRCQCHTLPSRMT